MASAPCVCVSVSTVDFYTKPLSSRRMTGDLGGAQQKTTTYGGASTQVSTLPHDCRAARRRLVSLPASQMYGLEWVGMAWRCALPWISADPPVSPLLGRLPEELPDLFEVEVLRRLGPRDLASLAGAGRGCAAAVAATALMKWGKDEKSRYFLNYSGFSKSALWFGGHGRGYYGGLSYNSPLRLEEACLWAAVGGHMDVLKWLHSTGSRMDETTCAGAAGGGNLEVLRWAREQGCQWDRLTCAFALIFGHVEVLRWARGHDCPWDKHTCFSATGRLETLRWAREHHLGRGEQVDRIKTRCESAWN